MPCLLLAPNQEISNGRLRQFFMVILIIFIVTILYLDFSLLVSQYSSSYFVIYLNALTKTCCDLSWDR